MLESFQRHIADNHASRQGKAWCGADIKPDDWTFDSVDHAAMTSRNGDYLQPCPECAKAVIAAFYKGGSEYWLHPDDAVDIMNEWKRRKFKEKQ